LKAKSASQLAAEHRIVWPRSILCGDGPANSPMPSCIPTANSMRIEAERVRQATATRFSEGCSANGTLHGNHSLRIAAPSERRRSLSSKATVKKTVALSRFRSVF